MPIGDYLKLAAAQLRRAAMVRRDEAQELRRAITMSEQETSRKVSTLKSTMNQLQANLGAATEGGAKALISAELVGLDQQIKDAQSGLTKEKQRIQQEIQWKEGEYNSLNDQAGNFERQASAGGL